MNSPEQDPIERLLREQDDYIPDNGFTTRVMSALPQRRNYIWLKRSISLLTLLIGVILAVRWLSPESLPTLNFDAVFSLDSRVLSAWIPFLVVIGALARSAYLAFQSED